jgi:hypothetical protein
MRLIIGGQVVSSMISVLVPIASQIEASMLDMSGTLRLKTTRLRELNKRSPP